MATIPVHHSTSSDDGTEANRSFFVHMFMGALIGTVVGAVVFFGMFVAILSRSDTPHAGAAWIGLLVGALFGSFLGGWGGVVVFDGKTHKHAKSARH